MYKLSSSVLSAAVVFSAALDTFRGSVTDWTVRDWADGPIRWRFFEPPGARSPSQGWKVHVSASAVESEALLSKITPVLSEIKAAFKIPRYLADVVFLNSGAAGAQMLGKVVTIYPETDDHAREIITTVDAVWPTSHGPEVQTDLHVRPGSAVSFRYGIFQDNGQKLVNGTGLHEFALTLPDGSLVPDTRSLFGEQPPMAPPIEGYPPRSWPLGPNKIFQVQGHHYMVLTRLSASPRARIFLGVDLERLETVVIKVGRPGVWGDESGSDIRNLLKREFDILGALSNSGIAPHVIAYQDEHWPVVVMEDFRGDILSDLPRSERIKFLPKLAFSLAQVHQAGFVHGDIKLANAVRRGEQVGLIDFELAQREGSTAHKSGTRGYMGPEIALESPAAYSRDIYALAGCTVEAILDLPIGWMPSGTGKLLALLHNERQGRAAKLVAAFAAVDPAARPTAIEAASALAAFAASGPVSPAEGSLRDSDRDWLRRASIEAAHLTDVYSVSTSNGLSWRNEHFQKRFTCEAINIGAAGIVIGLASIDSAFGRSDFARQISEGARWLASRSALGNAAGLFSGNAGVALALAMAGCRFADRSYVAAARARLEAAVTDRREIDLFSGRAGVVWAGCILADMLQEDWPLDLVRVCVDEIVQGVDLSGDIPRWSTDAYIGCAHGSAGIAMALGRWGQTGDQRCTELALATFQRIYRYGRTDDGLALRMTHTRPRHHFVGNWCHGVAGNLWAMLQGVGDHPAVRSEIDWSVDCLADAMSIGTPTYCHGLAGQLEMWRMLLAIPRFRTLATSRAAKVVRALRAMHIKRNGKCAWTADDPEVITPDLWVGFLGPASALALYAIGSSAPLFSGEWLSRCAALAEHREAHGHRSPSTL